MMRGTFNNRKTGGCLLLLLTLSIAGSVQGECDKTKCPGPIAPYEDLKCKPIYENKGDCCAVRYDCSHLTKGRSKDNCYINGSVYKLGEPLKDEDSSPCDVGCTCVAPTFDGHVPMFNCAVVDCFQGPAKPGCYFKQSPLSCCSGGEVCQDRAVCNVNGKIYLDGEFFTADDDPNLNCACQPGYEGKNVEPFCKRSNGCRTEFHHISEILLNCAPVFYSSPNPQTSCAVLYRCQNNNDTVVHEASEESPANVPDEMKCKFGNMTLLLGEELNQATDYSSVCVKCVCEVPPLMTCQRLPDEECDITKHPPFHNFK